MMAIIRILSEHDRGKPTGDGDFDTLLSDVRNITGMDLQVNWSVRTVRRWYFWSKDVVHYELLRGITGNEYKVLLTTPVLNNCKRRLYAILVSPIWHLYGMRCLNSEKYETD